MNFCPKCGSPNQPGARFCEKCGGPLQAAPPQQVPGPQFNDAAAQAKDALQDGMAAVKKLDPKILIGIGAAVLVVLVAIFFMPMSEKTYESKSEDAWDDFGDAMSDLYDATYKPLEDVDDYDDDLSDKEVDRLRDDYKEASKALKDAAGDIRGLRPPGDYKDADKYMREMASYAKGDYLKAIDDLIDEAKKGMSYEDYSEALSDLQDDSYEFYEDMDEDLAEAFEDLQDEW